MRHVLGIDSVELPLLLHARVLSGSEGVQTGIIRVILMDDEDDSDDEDDDD